MSETRVGAILAELSARLRAKDLEPKELQLPSAEMRGAAEQLGARVREGLVQALAAQVALEGARQAYGACVAAAWVGAGVAAAATAAGLEALAIAVCADLAAVVEAEPWKGLLEAGARRPRELRALIHARWLRSHGQTRAAHALYGKVIAEATEPTIREAAETLRDAPDPIQKAPTLFTFNGVGSMLYGKRDVARDGSYVTTLCFCVLFVPLLPLAAYRVFADGGSRYRFVGKVPLSSFAIWARRLTATALVVGVLGGSFNAYWTSPSHQVEVAMAEGARLVAAGQPEAAEELYATLIQDLGPKEASVLRPVVEALTAQMLASIPNPIPLAEVDRAERVLERFGAIPVETRAGAKAAVEVAVLRWAQDLAGTSLERQEAALRLIEAAGRVLKPTTKFDALGSEAHRALAALLEPDDPVAALSHFLALGAAGTREAARLAKELVAFPPLVAEEVAVFAALEASLKKAPGNDELLSAITGARTEAAAAADDADRRAALERGELQELQALERARPWDQEVAVALAARRTVGQGSDADRALIARFGKPGHLIRLARLWLAQVALSTGRLQDAERILERLVGARIGAFRAANDAFGRALRESQARWIAAARSERPPPDLEKKLNGLPEAAQEAAFVEWLREKMVTDRAVTGARAEIAALHDVVEASVMLGTVKLRRAQEESGEARADLLAAAERAFLALSGAAEGNTRFHLGLGQVYHRTGRQEKGDEELGRLLKDEDLEVHLEVAQTYRDLGLHARALAIVEDIYKKASGELRDAAAVQGFLLSTSEDDRRAWLQRANQKIPFVATSLLELEGESLKRQGKYKEADLKFAAAVNAHLLNAALDSSGSNNAALALLQRFDCTGDPSNLRRSVDLLERALRTSPSSTIVLSNLASTVELLAQLAVLDRWVKTRDVVHDGDEADTLIDALSGGSARGAVLGALQASPLQRRAMSLVAQLEALSPGAVGPYQTERGWANRFQDDGLRTRLLGRAGRQPKLDTAAEERRAELWKQGAFDVEVLDHLNARVARRRGLIAQLEKGSNKPTLAALLLLQAEDASRLAWLRDDPERLEEAVVMQERAGSLWPECVDVSDQAQARLDLALFQELRRDPKWSWRSGGEHRSTLSLMAELERARSEVLGRLAQRPEAKVALEALLSGTNPNRASRLWFLARVVGDGASRARAQEQLASLTVREDLELLLLTGAYRDDASSTKEALEVARAGLSPR